MLLAIEGPVPATSVFSEFGHSESGFSLIEILIALAILSILAVIAYPHFLDQRAKAKDVCVKNQLIATRTAVEVFRVENLSYAGATTTKLRDYDKSIPTGPAGGCPGTTEFNLQNTANADATCGGLPSETEFCVTALSETGNRFMIARLVSGTLLRNCTAAGNTRAGCPTSGYW